MVCSACSVNSIYSMNTCFMEEYDLPISLPQSISFADGRHIDYLYAASGEKLRETYTSLDGLCDRTRHWAGPWEFVDGQPDRLLTPQGYIDPQGTLHSYIPDYQGNILAVVNTASGALEQSTDYYPYGLPHADAAGADRNRRKFGAKELISEYALHEYDFSARRLPAIIPAFSRPDPLAEKYHWLSPYAYSAADPINLIDPTGMKVKAIGKREQQMIKNTIHSEDCNYVDFDSYGFLNLSLMQSHKSNSWNYCALKNLAKSNDLFIVKLVSSHDFKNDENEIQTLELGSITYEDEFYIPEELEPLNPTTGETGFFGKTLFPGQGISNQNSPNEYIYILVNSQLSNLGAAQAFSHEGYGHAYLYVLTGNRKASSHDFIMGLGDLNKHLLDFISKAITETTINYILKE